MTIHHLVIKHYPTLIHSQLICVGRQTNGHDFKSEHPHSSSGIIRSKKPFGFCFYVCYVKLKMFFNFSYQPTCIKNIIYSPQA